MCRAPRRYALIAVLGTTFLSACGGDTTGPSGPSGPPVIADVNGATQPSGPKGSTVVIDGQNFGTTQGSGALLFTNTTRRIVSASDWTNTFIVTTVPSGAATGPVVVKTSGGTSNAVTFTLTQNAAFSPSAITWTATS